MRINVHAVMRVLHHTLRVERDRVEAEAPVVFEVLAPCLRVDDNRRGFYGNLGKNALYRRDKSVTLRRLRDVAVRPLLLRTFKFNAWRIRITKHC